MTNLILETSRTLTTKVDPLNNKKNSSWLVGVTIGSQKTEYTFKQLLQNQT